MDGTLRDYLRNQKAPAKLGEYIMGSGRAGWKYLLPISNTSTVLDLGCGWGTLAYGLAHGAKEVVAMDSTMERMQLLWTRAQKDNIHNLSTVCAGDGKHLPFEKNTFDIIILNGVLEWVPSGMNGHPGDLQLGFLKEVRRVLSPQGCLFLGIENRHAWKTWFRNPDGHTNLRYVPWLPRWAASAYSRMMGKGPYRNWLYSRSQYVQLLKRAGFHSTEFHVPLPGYHHPIWMVPLDQPDQISSRIQRKVQTFSQQVKQKLKGRLSALFPDAFNIVAHVEQTQPTYVDQLFEHLQSNMKGALGHCKPKKAQYRINAEMGMVTVMPNQQNKEGRLIIKLPLHQQAADGLHHECKFIQSPPTPCASLIPSMLAKGNFKGQEYVAFSYIPGVSGDHFIGSEKQERLPLKHAVEFLSQLHAISKPSAKGNHLLPSLTQRVVRLAASTTQRAAVDNAGAACRDHASSLEATSWCFGHGDFKLANLIFDKESHRLNGAIDWGCWTASELPGYELAFLLTDLKWRQGCPLPQVFSGWKSKLPKESWALRAIEDHAHHTGDEMKDGKPSWPGNG